MKLEVTPLCRNGSRGALRSRSEIGPGNCAIELQSGGPLYDLLESAFDNKRPVFLRVDDKQIGFRVVRAWGFLPAPGSFHTVFNLEEIK